MSPIHAPTVAQLPALAGRAYQDRPALRFKHEGTWQLLSYAELATAVEEIALGLRRVGVRPGDTVGLLSETRFEWTLCDLAIAQAGAVCVPVYPTSSPEECAWVLGHSESRVVICEDAGKAAVAGSLPGVETVIVISPSGEHLSLDELRRPATASEASALAEVALSVGADAVATIVYTSGTTGPPKGCMLTHANWRASLGAAAPLMDPAPEDVTYLHLPLAHLLSRIVQLLALEYGATIAYFGGDIREVITELAEVRPTHLPSVPKLFEKVYAHVRDLPPSVVRDAFGGRVRLAVTGSAPISPEILEFYASCGIPIFEGYGMTESTALISANTPGNVRYGTVGKPFSNVDVRIADDGEVLARGENVFAGYLRNPEATAETVRDGWLHTGDLGVLDADGYLTITGRKKDIIITSGGKNLTPANLENDLRQVPWISQAVMLGDRRPFPIVLVTLDPETIGPWAAERGLPAEMSRLVTRPEVQALIRGHLDEINQRYAPVARPRRLAILDHEFTVEDGTLTPTLKIKRPVVTTKYADLIDQLYT